MKKFFSARLDQELIEEVRKRCFVARFSKQQIAEDALRFYFGEKDPDLEKRRALVVKAKAARI